MGTGLEKLIEGLEFLSPRQKVLVCQGAGIAVPGVYPFVFTDRGYQGQLDWLADTAAYKAPIADQAYVTLLAIAKEGAITLPQHITVELTSGHQVYLGPKLTTPKPGPLARRTTLSMTLSEQYAVVQHLAEKEVALESTGMEEEEEDEEEEKEKQNEEMEKEEREGKEGRKEEDLKKEGADDKRQLSKEKQEEKVQTSYEEEQERKENEEDKKNKRAEEKQSRADSQRAFEEEDDNKAKTITVTFNNKEVSAADLNKHFEQYGKVVNVFVSATDNNFATITFKSEALAQWLAGMERHTLQRSKAHGGPVAMKLHGCGQVWAARLPGGSGRGNARRRSPVQQQNITNPLRFFVDGENLKAYKRMISRNPHTLTAAQLYALIRLSPAQFRQYCAATQLATPITSSMTHEARVFAWRFR